MRRNPGKTYKVTGTLKQGIESARYVKIVHWHRRQQGVIANR